ncbi:MAG: hypothetical protein JNN04_05285 [Cyclobacteriaceae bacterium]|nr:hypothetical protein [Cyclobacteriaceae bacterium]
MRTLKKVFLYTSLALVVLLVSTVAILYLYKDRIIQQFIREANKSLGTPITIGKIDVTLLDDFPRLSIVFQEVYIEDSHPGKYPLLTAKTVSFSLHPWDVYQGRYVVQGLKLNESETNLRISKEGKTNYAIVKSGAGSQGSVAFDLKDVNLLKSTVTYIDLSVVQHHTFTSEKLIATILARGDTYSISAAGDLTIGQIGIGKSRFLEEKSFDVTSALEYDDLAKTLLIQSSTLVIGDNRFEVSGDYSFKEKNVIALKITGKDTDVQSLLALLPPATAKRFVKYQSRGDVYFDATLTGEISRQRSPSFAISFGFRDVTLTHPDYQSSIEKVNLEGRFQTPSLSTFTRAELSLQQVKATLNGTPVTGNFHLRNFEDPYVRLEFHGEPKATDVLRFFPVTDLSDVSGSLRAHVSLEGQVALLKDKTTAQQVKTEGTVELDSLNFSYGKRKLRFSNLSGVLQFNNNDLAMSNLRGAFEASDFLVNGFFKNIVTYAIFDNQPIGIEADLKSRFLDVDRLFEVGFSETGTGPYVFSISPSLNLNFNCLVDSLTFKKFHARHVKGDLLVKGQVAVSRNINLEAMGGSLQLSGIVDAKKAKAIDLITSATLKGIYLDSLFYIFENFQQDFISHQHLRGTVDAEISLEATLNEALRMFPETLIADASALIRNGELNEFEPLFALHKYLDDEGLKHLRFADLKNDIHIENKTVFIPQMEIRSNVTTLALSGTHGFDKKIDYRIIAPLRNKKKIDPDEAFGAIESDLQGRSKVYLKITGTTDNYKVQYDQVAVRKKIASDIKKEVQELKEAFRLKGKKKKKELELQKDDYFDWEEKK